MTVQASVMGVLGESKRMPHQQLIHHFDFIEINKRSSKKNLAYVKL